MARQILRGRPKKYNARTLKTALNRYFRSISREVAVTEMVPTGERDDKGHMIMESVPVLNQDGNQLMKTEYLIPPTVEGMCLRLGIHDSTWNNYCDPEKNPEMQDVTTEAREIFRAWLIEESLTRPGKDVRGIQFNLQNNYGYSEKKEVELGERATKAVSAASIPMEERKQLLMEMVEAAAVGDDDDKE